MPISGGDPADLIRAYLAQVTGAPASALPVPEGMGDMRQRMLDPVTKLRAAALDPGFVGKTTQGIVPESNAGAGGEGRQPLSPLSFRTPEVQQIKNETPPEDMFKFKDYVADKQKDAAKESEAARIARLALEKIKAQIASSGAKVPDRAATLTPETPSQFEGQHTQNVPVNQQAFFKTMLPHVVAATEGTNLDPRLVLAMAALESANGTAAPGNNFFGVKSHGKSGGQDLMTTEIVDGKPVKVKQSFRTYGSPQESVKDYVGFLKDNDRYADLLKAKTLDEQIAALAKSGYATDPDYASKVKSIANSIKLLDLQPERSGATATIPAPAPAATATSPTEPGSWVGEHRNGYFWNGTGWDKAETGAARGGAIGDLLAYSRNYR